MLPCFVIKLTLCTVTELLQFLSVYMLSKCGMIVAPTQRYYKSVYIICQHLKGCNYCTRICLF